MKKCPFCLKEIQDVEIKCPFCLKFLDNNKIISNSDINEDIHIDKNNLESKIVKNKYDTTPSLNPYIIFIIIWGVSHIYAGFLYNPLFIIIGCLIIIGSLFVKFAKSRFITCLLLLYALYNTIGTFITKYILRIKGVTTNFILLAILTWCSYKILIDLNIYHKNKKNTH